MSVELGAFLIWNSYTRMLTDIRTIDNKKCKYPTIWDEPRFYAKKLDQILIHVYYQLEIIGVPTTISLEILIRLYSELLLIYYNRIKKIIKDDNGDIINYYDLLFNDNTENQFIGLLIDIKEQIVYIKKSIKT